MKSHLKLSTRKTPVKYYAIHLRDMRTKKGLDQESLAHMAGISVRTIQRIESGNSCSLDTLKSVSAALDLKHFSELLPQPNNNEYHPKLINLMAVITNELVIWTAIRSLILTCFIIGFFCFLFVEEQASGRYDNVSIEDRVALKMELNKKFDPDHKHLALKTETEISEQIQEEIARAKEPLSKSEWKEMYKAMIICGFLSLMLNLIYGFNRIFSTYEFDQLVSKPIGERLSSLLAFKK